ncbi:MAG: sulfotransferase, partial [Alphaproteobacteria bacterium]
RTAPPLDAQDRASAPGAQGARDLTALADVARNSPEPEGRWPAGAGRLAPGRVTQLATAYLVHIHRLAPKAERVVDKMPANAQNVGLILSLFPNATIIHTRRDPLDNCFGCYRQLFRGGVDYCYDQEELGRYHQGLMRLLDHWKAIAPGRIVEVDYRTLVEDFETEARRLVDAVGAPWSDACLAFHETVRDIDTASSVQVRRPIFTSGIGSADRFRP